MNVHNLIQQITNEFQFLDTVFLWIKQCFFLSYKPLFHNCVGKQLIININSEYVGCTVRAMNSYLSDVNDLSNCEWRRVVTSFVTFHASSYPRYVWRLVCRINISKVANETNSYRTTPPSLDSTESFLSAALAPSSGAAMLYNVPCYHNYSPLSCYQVRLNGLYVHQPRPPGVIQNVLF
jgi:hypothetical protein